jgi:hypothetical protein
MSCSVPGSQTGPSSSVDDLILEEPVLGRSSTLTGSGPSPTSLPGTYLSFKFLTLSLALIPIFLRLPNKVFFSGGPETCSSSPPASAFPGGGAPSFESLGEGIPNQDPRQPPVEVLCEFEAR